MIKGAYTMGWGHSLVVGRRTRLEGRGFDPRQEWREIFFSRVNLAC